LGTIRIEIRKDKINRENKAPLRLIYQLERKRHYIPLGKFVFPFNWEAKDQQAVYFNFKSLSPKINGLPVSISKDQFLTQDDIKDLNGDLISEIRKLEKIEAKFIDNGIAFNGEMILNEYFSTQKKAIIKSPKHGGEFYQLIENFIADREHENKKASLVIYKTVKSHLQSFSSHMGFELSLENINDDFFNKLKRFLNNTKNLNNTTANKVLSTVKTVINYGIKKKYKFPNYQGFKISKDKLPVYALTEKEFLDIYNLDLSGNKRLAKVRDLFCFSCSSGLRYSDLAQLKQEHIQSDAIKFTSIKTSTELFVPLNSYSKAILQKYEGLATALPIISGQRINEYLKEVGILAGIDTQVEKINFKGNKRINKFIPKHQLMTIHMGRRTFCTISLAKGINAQTVMTLSGHTDYKSFQRYIDIGEEQKREAMEKGWG
jgi:integrase